MSTSTSLRKKTQNRDSMKKYSMNNDKYLQDSECRSESSTFGLFKCVSFHPANKGAGISWICRKIWKAMESQLLLRTICVVASVHSARHCTVEMHNTGPQGQKLKTAHLLICCQHFHENFGDFLEISNVHLPKR